MTREEFEKGEDCAERRRWEAALRDSSRWRPLPPDFVARALAVMATVGGTRKKPIFSRMPRWALLAASLAIMIGFVFAATVVIVGGGSTAKEAEGTRTTEGTLPEAEMPIAISDAASAVAAIFDGNPPSSICQQPSGAEQLEGEAEMTIKQKAATVFTAATLAAAQVAVRGATASCVVSGSTDRDASIEIGPVAINSELDTRPAPEVRLDGLNLRTDEPSGLLIQLY